jgi:hypothetical protein
MRETKRDWSWLSWLIFPSMWLVPFIFRALTSRPPQEIRAIAMDNAIVTASATGGSVIDCSGIDSDNDGYVSCSTKSNTNTIIEIECSYTKGGGCKIKQQKYPTPISH